jgi:hypothetical protein
MTSLSITTQAGQIWLQMLILVASLVPPMVEYLVAGFEWMDISYGFASVTLEQTQFILRSTIIDGV